MEKTPRLFLSFLLVLLIPLALSPAAYGDEEPLDEEEIWDPIEPVNRGIFWFNDKFDIYFYEPVAQGYDYIMPDRAQKGVTNFFRNIKYPIYLVSNVIKFDFSQALKDTGRFLINSTVGVLGLMDVAKDHGLPDHDNDVGAALGYHGLPGGPYLVIPFLGPSNLRDAVGLVADGFADPIFYINYGGASYRTKYAVTSGLVAVKYVDKRARLLDAVEAAKESSLDYYLFMQSAYQQYRQGVISGGRDSEEVSVAE